MAIYKINIYSIQQKIVNCFTILFISFAWKVFSKPYFLFKGLKKPFSLRH